MGQQENSQSLDVHRNKTRRVPITNTSAALRAGHQCSWTPRNVTKCTSSTPCWCSDARNTA